MYMFNCTSTSHFILFGLQEEYKAALKRAENARKEIQRLGQAESDGVLSEGRPRLEKKVNSTTAVDGGLKVRM